MDHERARIVVGLDGSAGSRAALKHALREAVQQDATVEVVAVYTPPEYWVPLFGVPPVSADDVHDEVRRNAAAIVDEVAGRLGGHDAHRPPVTVTAVPGAAAEALLRAAGNADLLVVGSHGHGRPGGKLLGSVSRQCVQQASCPVTVVHAARRRRPRNPSVLRRRRPPRDSHGHRALDPEPAPRR